MDLLQMIMESEQPIRSNKPVAHSLRHTPVRIRVRDTVPAIITFENTNRRLKNAHFRWKCMAMGI